MQIILFIVASLSLIVVVVLSFMPCLAVYVWHLCLFCFNSKIFFYSSKNEFFPINYTRGDMGILIIYATG